MGKASYSCPKCGYSTTRKSNINDHFNNRKKPCKAKCNSDEGFELTDTIKQAILNSIYVSPTTQINNNCNNSTINNVQNNNILIQYIIDGKIEPKEVISRLADHVEHYKYGDEILLKRVEDIRTEIEEGSDKYVFSSDNDQDLHMITDKMTKCLDQKMFSDAYYSFSPKTFTYCMRTDEDNDDNRHNWYWKNCSETEIVDHIMIKMKERVFDDYDTMLCRIYNDNPNKYCEHKLIGFFKILKYFLIKPKCCSAAHDNEIIYYSTDDEYYNFECGTILKEKLISMYNGTAVDVYDMMNTRKGILKVIENNAASTWSNIKNKVLEVTKLDPDIVKKAHSKGQLLPPPRGLGRVLHAT